MIRFPSGRGTALVRRVSPAGSRGRFADGALVDHLADQVTAAIHAGTSVLARATLLGHPTRAPADLSVDRAVDG